MIKFIINSLEQISNVSNRLSNNLKKLNSKRARKNQIKSLIKEYPAFKANAEDIEKNFNKDFDALCNNMLDDVSAKWEFSYYIVNYDGKHGKISLWVANFPYGSHVIYHDAKDVFAYHNSTNFISTDRCSIETMIRFSNFQKLIFEFSGKTMNQKEHGYVCFDRSSFKLRTPIPRKLQ